MKKILFLILNIFLFIIYRGSESLTARKLSILSPKAQEGRIGNRQDVVKQLMDKSSEIFNVKIKPSIVF